mgnify:CR=1 FL=1
MYVSHLLLHDFRSYADAEAAERSTRVKVERVEVAEAGDLLLVRNDQEAACLRLALEP